MMDFEDLMDATKDARVVAYFSTDWCGPCRQFGPMLAAECERAGVRLIKFNTDENQKLARQLNVRSVPQTFVIENGKVLHQKVGAVVQREIREALK